MSRQLECNIAHSSVWQKLYVAVFLLCTGLVLLSVDLSWSWRIAITIISLILYSLCHITRDQPIHITACNIDDSKANWQLLYQGRRGQRPVLWEAELVKVQSLSNCIQFTFHTIHPMARKKTIVIWQDQIPAPVWRRLKVLANWW